MPGPAPCAVTVADLVVGATAAAGSPAEGRWIVAHALGLRTGDLTARLGEAVSAEVARSVASLGERRRSGEPLQYVLGTWAFRTLEVAVDHRVLVPRPETELLVDVGLDELESRAGRAGGPLVVVDLGTGSGVVALSLAAEWRPRRGGRPKGARAAAELEVWATDVSGDALAVAEANRLALAQRHPRAAARVRTARGVWFAALDGDLAGRVDVVVSNPPYVAAGEWDHLDAEVREHEPRLALVAGHTGREAVDAVLHDARRWLAPGGAAVLELAPHQAALSAARAGALGYVDVEILPDLTRRPRLLRARLPDAGAAPRAARWSPDAAAGTSGP